jgi:hypothetical protein
MLGAFVFVAALTTGCRQCGGDVTAPEAARTSAPEGRATGAATLPTPADAVAPASAPVGGWPNARSSLGTNLSGVSDWGSEIPFIDAFRASRELTSGSPTAWGDDRKLDIDARGWLRSLASNQEARTVVLNGPQFRSGRYLVLYEGRGEYRYAGTAQLDTAASKPGRDVVMVDRARGDLGIAMDFTAIDKRDPIRNIRMIPPGGACDTDRARFCDADNPCPTGACLAFEEHYQKLVFHPDFLARTQRFGMLRFMDMMQTNNSNVVRWDQRGQLGNQTWVVNGGVPFEVMAQLTNQLRAQPWFCVPHQADDDYVRKLAEQAKALIDPALPIWIEYSNEVWNAGFQQHHYALKRAGELGYPSDFQGVLRFYARRSLEVFKIFESVLGKERVKAVVGSQAVNTWVSTEILDFPGIKEHADALAIAPYFGRSPGPEDLAKFQKMTLDQLIERTKNEYLPETKKWVADQSAIAKQYGIELVAYEAGQHFVGTQGAENDERLNKLFDALNRDPRMKDLYLTYLENWKASGGTWLNHFVNCDKWSKWGRWGALEEIRQPREQSPKFDALMTFIDKHERWW